MHEGLVRLALEAGAARAEIISGTQIVLSESFREDCRKNYCGQWGKCWMCPPAIGEITQLISQVRSYSTALLYQTITRFTENFDLAAMLDAGKDHIRISRRMEEQIAALLGKHLHLSSGGCHFCDRCAKLDDLPCPYPEHAISSMEAYGIDVANTCKTTKMRYMNGENTVTYFGIILF